MITGKVTDATSGQPLPFANVYYSNSSGSPTSNKGTTTDIQGKYSLELFRGETHLTASYLGFAQSPRAILSDVINFALQPTAINLPEVEITAKKPVTWHKKAIIITGIALFLFAIYLFMKPKF